MAIIALGTPAGAGAQGVRLSGHVVRATGHGRAPLAEAWVVLHRLSAAGMGPVDSVRTRADGAYLLTITAPDTAAEYLVGVRYAGVGYLSADIAPGPRRERRLDTLVVYDSSSTEDLALAQRHLLIQPPNPDGSVPVLELMVLRNAGMRTRVPRDSTEATWSTRLLSGATGAEIGESDLSHDIIEHDGDSITVTGPVTPGDKQIVVTYLVPRSRELVLPVNAAIGTLGIMIADTLATGSPSLRSYEITSFENIRYRRFEATDLPAGASVVMRMSALPARPGDLWWLVVAVSALGMIAAAAAWWRAERARGGLGDAEVLALQVAALDDAGQARDDPAVGARRAGLLRQLENVLAEGNGPP